MNKNINIGFKHSSKIFYNLSVPSLVEHTLANEEGLIGAQGEIMCSSGKYTGRSPDDKFFVYENGSKSHINWGPVNQKLDSTNFDQIYKNVVQFLTNKNLYVNDGYAGADSRYQLGIRFINTKAWHAHFTCNMFIKVEDSKIDDFEPSFLVINACEYLEKDWKNLGLNSPTFVIINLAKKIVLIGGTEYAGEIKKGIFSVLNYMLPLDGIMPMHCSATVGKKGESAAIYFGLSGTGKTTLSADPNRKLIGDDEHGWSDYGIFNFEGGCYAKTIRLSAINEPDIWNAIRFGSLLENVTFDEKTREVYFDDSTITENSRVSYPIRFIKNYEPSGMAEHPKYIFMLTCDAFGVMPPVAKLKPNQASYHFLTGYTAKIAGTERGVTEPQATFSTCFGKPFMSQSPNIYSNLLKQKMKTHNTRAFLINTGWLGGKKGKRISLPITRKIITSILNGELDNAEFIKDPIFGFLVPKAIKDIDHKILDPVKSWSNTNDYNQEYIKLAKMFVENFDKEHKSYASDLVSFGPNV